MNVSIGLRKDHVLWTRFQKLAQREKFFMLEWHNGGKSGTWAATSMRCLQCDAIINIGHPGLPAKQGAKQDPQLIAKVNDAIVNFLFSEEYIEKKDLRARRVCTVERFYANEVIARKGNQSTASPSSSAKGVATAPPKSVPSPRARSNRWTMLGTKEYSV